MRKKFIALAVSVAVLFGTAVWVGTHINAVGASSRRIVSVNLRSTCNEALAEDGSLYMLGSMWGSRSYEDLTEAANADHYTPIKILSNVESVNAGFNQKGAITKNGDLYMWGDNDFGALGDGKSGTDDRLLPEKILSNVHCISYGHWSIGAVTKDGSLYMWGSNSSGELGDGTTEDRNRPVKVLSDATSVSIDQSTTGAVTKDGSLYMWGWNDSGQVGNGTTKDCYEPVKVLSNVDFANVGYDCCGAVTKDGSLYMWGKNNRGQVGNGTTEDCYKPVKVLSDVISVSVDGSTVGAITKDGSLYMWGNNSDGQVGNGTTENCTQPAKVLSDVACIKMQGLYTGAITKDGSLYMWGNNIGGQLGDGTTESRYTPVKVLSNVVSIAYNRASGWNVGAVTKDGDLYVWGTNNDGIIGDGSTEDRHTPVKVLSNVNFFEFGYDCCGAVTKDGSLYMWGSNDGGQLGDGTTKDRHTPVKISFLSARNSQKITYHITGIKNRKVVHGSSFSLNAKTTGTGKLTYKSSNTKILSVNAKGKVTVKGYGPAYIQIKAAGGNGYKAAVRKIKLIAVPKQGKITKAEWQKSGVRIQWKPEKTADGYEYAIAYNKKFSSQSRKKTKKTGLIMTKYKTGTKKMYVKVRTYKKAGKKTYYGSWSKVRALKLKKARKTGESSYAIAN